MLRFASLSLSIAFLVATANPSDAASKSCNVRFEFQGKLIVACVDANAVVNFKPLAKADSWQQFGKTQYGAWVKPVLAGSKLGESIYFYYGPNQRAAMTSNCALNNSGRYIGFRTNYTPVVGAPIFEQSKITGNSCQ
jgi:hypothetical protein